MRWLDSITDSMDMNLSNLQVLVKDREIMFASFARIIWSQVPDFNGEGDGTPLQYSCLENPTDRGAW